eukprot:TRINITY_DN31238_c0_g1_i1.p1 TRINITY_DN31238_c0_g1~~TRINITY_DN31238_c0_g1_i1.p1  ORF type:complete len:306 (+),score=-0.86 TRINITY_DN31238_c0_g1_i1:58-975(+)
MTPNRLAIITGANRGIGLEVARILANNRNEGGMQQSMQIIGLCRDIKGAEKALCDVVPNLSSDSASQHRVIPFDAMNYPTGVDAALGELEETLRRASDEVRAGHSGLDPPELYLVNNAAIYLDSWSPKAYRESVVVNFLSPMRLLAGVMEMEKRLNAEGRGSFKLVSVVNVSSGYGKLSELSRDYWEQITNTANSSSDATVVMSALSQIQFSATSSMQNEYVAPYKVTKAMLNAATRVMAESVMADSEFNRNVRINAVCPGWCRTRMGGGGASRSAEQGARSVVATLLNATQHGGFYRDGDKMEW